MGTINSGGASRWLTVGATLLVLTGLVFISLNLSQNLGQDIGAGNGQDILLQDDAALTQETLRIGDELQCPICEGQSVAYSNSRLATEMRAQITEQLQAGANEAEIKQYFVDRYGVVVLREPPRTGLNTLLWQMPFVAIGLGALILGWTLIQTNRNRKLAVASVETDDVPLASSDSDTDVFDPEIQELLAQYDGELFGTDTRKNGAGDNEAGGKK